MTFTEPFKPSLTSGWTVDHPNLEIGTGKKIHRAPRSAWSYVGTEQGLCRLEVEAESLELKRRGRRAIQLWKQKIHCESRAARAKESLHYDAKEGTSGWGRHLGKEHKMHRESGGVLNCVWGWEHAGGREGWTWGFPEEARGGRWSCSWPWNVGGSTVSAGKECLS